MLQELVTAVEELGDGLGDILRLGLALAPAGVRRFQKVSIAHAKNQTLCVLFEKDLTYLFE